MAGDPRLAGARVLLLLLNVPFFGSERLMVRTAEILDRAGAEVLVATCDWEFGGIRRELTRRQIAWTDITMRGAFRRRGALRWIVRMWIEAIRSALRVRAVARRFGPTHVIVPDETNMLYALPLLLTHGSTASVYVPANVPDDARASRSWLYRFFLRHVAGGVVDVVVANSMFTEQALRRSRPRRARITRIPCCLPAREVPGADAALDAVDPARFNIVYVGQLARHKGVHLLVDAAIALVARHPDVDVIVAGPVDPASSEQREWQRRVAERGMADRIRFIGEVKDVPRLMRAASLHVMPSRCDESFGLTVLEAKQAGVPSVIFPAGALPELVRHGLDGYVCGGTSVADLIEGVEFFVGHAERRATAAAAAHQSAARYSFGEFAQRWGDTLVLATQAHKNGS